MTGLAERITAPGPKRLLAVDGGGIRGILALEILAEIERILGGGRAVSGSASISTISAAPALGRSSRRAWRAA